MMSQKKIAANETRRMATAVWTSCVSGSHDCRQLPSHDLWQRSDI